MPQVHTHIFRRYSPYNKKEIDINDFRKIFDVYGSGISLGSSKKVKPAAKLRQGLVPARKTSEIRNKSKANIKDDYSKKSRPNYSDSGNFTTTSGLIGHANEHKDSHKQRVYHVYLSQGSSVSKGFANPGESSMNGEGRYITLAE